MEKEINTDVKKRGSKAKPVGVALPVNLTAVGKTADGDVRVYIKQNVYKEIGKLSEADNEKESVSVLTGQTLQESGKTHVVISGYIDAKHVASTAAAFTGEMWEYVETERKKNCPDKSIVGYQHTLTGGGSALSDNDIAVYEKYFTMPYQVAYITDSVRGERAFFQRKEGKAEKLEGYYIYDEAGIPLFLEQEQKKPEKKVRFKKLTAAAALLLLASTIALSIALISLTGNQTQNSVMNEEAQELLESRIEEQQAEIELQMNKIEELENAIPLSNDDGSKQLEQKLAEQQTLLEQREQEMAQMKELLDSIGKKTDGKVVYFKKYVVEKGDSLSSICRSNDIKYLSNRRVILAVNGIKNENLIRVGQTILLPVVTVLEK